MQFVKKKKKKQQQQKKTVEFISRTKRGQFSPELVLNAAHNSISYFTQVVVELMAWTVSLKDWEDVGAYTASTGALDLDRPGSLDTS